jgi:hypothetical protein
MGFEKEWNVFLDEDRGNMTDALKKEFLQDKAGRLTFRYHNISHKEK